MISRDRIPHATQPELQLSKILFVLSLKYASLSPSVASALGWRLRNEWISSRGSGALRRPSSSATVMAHLVICSPLAQHFDAYAATKATPPQFSASTAPPQVLRTPAVDWIDENNRIISVTISKEGSVERGITCEPLALKDNFCVQRLVNCFDTVQGYGAG